MSNRRKDQPPPKPQGMPANVMFRYGQQYQFEVQSSDIVLVAWGRNGIFHTDGDAIPVADVLDFCNKFQEVVANIVRGQQPVKPAAVPPDVVPPDIQITSKGKPVVEGKIKP